MKYVKEHMGLFTHFSNTINLMTKCSLLNNSLGLSSLLLSITICFQGLLRPVDYYLIEVK